MTIFNGRRKNSIIIAICATVNATVIASMAALTLGRNRRVKHKMLFSGILILPLMIPEIVTAVATLTFFSAIGLSLGLGQHHHRSYRVLHPLRLSANPCAACRDG